MYRAVPFYAVLLVLLGACCFTVSGQNIVDDSTKVIHGPKTSRYRLEQDIFNNTDTLHIVDTTLNDFHNSDDFIWRNNQAHQDLGVLGSPNKPLFFKLPNAPGIRYGIETLDLFAFDNAKVRYFNTRSPYSYIKYNFFGKTRSVFEGGFFRNITSGWNVGFDFKRISAQKSIGVTATDDPATAHVSFAAQTNYISKNARYIALANLKYLNHNFFETGGIRPQFIDSSSVNNGTAKKLEKDSLLRFDDSPVQLSTGTKAYEKRYEAHLYQQYALDTLHRTTQVFYIIDYNYRGNHYLDTDPTKSNYYNDTTIFRVAAKHGLDSIDNQTTYRLLENKFGLKGDYNHFRYALWLRRRDFGYSGRYFNYTGRSSETYFGASVNLNVNKNIYLENYAEYQPGRDYLLKTEMKLQAFSAGINLMQYAPSLFQQTYANNFFSWQNDFKFTQAQRAFADITLHTSHIGLHIGGEYFLLNNYIYMNRLSMPQQTDKPLQVGIGSFDLLLRAGNFHFDHFTKFSGTHGPDVIRMPRIFLTLRYYYQGSFFKDALRVQTGFNVRWKDAYYADNYNATLQTYYIQAEPNPNLPVEKQTAFLNDPYFVIDPFVNFGIKRTTFFLKMDNVNQGLGARGYFPTPFYSGQKRIFLIGLYWPFFD